MLYATFLDSLPKDLSSASESGHFAFLELSETMILNLALRVSGSFLTMNWRYSAKVLKEPAGAVEVSLTKGLVTEAKLRVAEVDKCLIVCLNIFGVVVVSVRSWI